jgi:hypothetical protein
MAKRQKKVKEAVDDFRMIDANVMLGHEVVLALYDCSRLIKRTRERGSAEEE